MANLRKSIPTLYDLSEVQFHSLIENDYFECSFTEKTDGFCMEVGFDYDISNPFYVRSATSGKMRNFGDFSKHAYKKFREREDYDPMIALRLDLALHVLKKQYKLTSYLSNRKTKISGEMILIIDGKPFSPKNTYLDYSKFGNYGSFIIHSKSLNNYHLPFIDIVKLCDDCSSISSLTIEHDIHDNINSIIKLSTNDLKTRYKNNELNVRKDLETQLLDFLPKKSKWGGFKPEGFVFHVNPNLKFKILLEEENKIKKENWIF